VASCEAAPPDAAQSLPTAPRVASSRPADAQREFVARVLGDTEDVWGGVFQQMGMTYRPPKLILFDGATLSACGLQSAQTGPAYCTRDHSIYLDPSFLEELSQRFGAPGDFPRAYVIANQVGHHVQDQLGLADEAQRRAAGASERVRNQVARLQELQADCLAGVWANSVKKRGLIDERDVESGIAAAMALGDDRIRRQARGNVDPETFTHGTSQQRAQWFKIGLESGDIGRCNTFASADTRAASGRGR